MLWKGLTVVRPSFQDFTNIHLRSAAAIQATTCQSYHHGRQHCCHHYASSSRRSRSSSWRSIWILPTSSLLSSSQLDRPLQAALNSRALLFGNHQMFNMYCNHCWQFGCITSSSRWRRLTELKPGGKRWVGCRRKISKELEMLSHVTPYWRVTMRLLFKIITVTGSLFQCAQRSQVSRIISWVIEANQQTCTPTI